MYKLGAIEAKLEAINTKLDEKEDRQDKEIANLKTDVSKLKHDRAYLLGAGAVIAFIVTFIQRVVPWSNLF